MRHNDARKWLHAVLDLLPVLLIPVFMIYSHRHDITHQTTVDIQYKYQSNEVTSVDDLVEGNIYHLEIFELSYAIDSYFKLVNGNINISITDASGDSSNIAIDDNIIFNLYNDGSPELYLYNSGDNIHNGYYVYFQITSLNVNCDCIYLGSTIDLDDYLPYISQSNFNVIESVDVHDETSSVMNVFMDNFNFAIDKYFNMGNVFNLNGVYQWFNTNIFNGNAPTVIYSVWNIALYELVMDLLFLLYGLFMWFIDMCKHLMEKPFRSIK